MARLLWLPDVLRAAGLTVHEYDGWRTRGSESWGPVRGITCHATAGSANSTDAGELRVLVTGSPSAPPPIAQLYLSRSGQWWVVASGRCNHNLVGWAGPNKGYGNSQLLGIEAQNDNRGQAWPAVQYDSYVRGVAALVKRLGIPVSRVAGHKEHQPAGYGKSSTKTDPTFDMARFRRDVTAALAAGKGSNMQLGDQIGIPAWARAQWPDSEQVTVRTALASGYSHSRAAHTYARQLLAQAEAARLRDEAILAAVQGLDTAAILARIDEHAQAAAADRDALAELVEQAVSGERDAREVVDEIGRRLANQQP